MSTIFNTGIRDNLPVRGTVGDFLKTKIHPDVDLSFVSAYFTIYAYEALKKELDQIRELRFLFGEPSFIRGIDPHKKQKKAFKIEDDIIRLENRLRQKRIALECSDWIKAKVEIRTVVREGFLHGKMYHIAEGGVESAIIGSSNFTVRGLGLSPSGNNIELNLIVDSDRDRNDLKNWFDELWDHKSLVRDVKADVLKYLEQLYQNHPPEFLYYLTLFHIFEKFLKDEKTFADLSRTTLFESQVWNTLFDFQKDGVKGVINKVLTHNGCILADSVGLGKTYEALAVIKFFETRNERVLVLCPKKLRENWSIYQAHTGHILNPFPKDRYGYALLHHSDLSRERGYSGDIDLENFKWGMFDLVVIDESHNFRNNLKGKRDEDGDIVHLSRYERLMGEIIKKGVKTKVLLLSATPVNNTLTDLRNQISLIAGGDVVHDSKANTTFKESIGISNLKECIKKAQTHFTTWAKQKPEERTITVLLERLGSDFFKLLDGLTIARSRRHITTYYKNSLEELGGFPQRTKPISIYPTILDSKNLFMNYDQLNDQISKYKLSLFNPSKFVKDEFKGEYEKKVGNFTQSQREHYLIDMMKVNFLKRLESSVYSFTLTLKRTLDKIEDLKSRINRFKEFQDENPEIDLASITPEELDDEEMRDALEVGKKLTFKMAHLKLDEWLEKLDQDHKQLRAIYLQAADVGPARDAKLDELKSRIRRKITHPTHRKDGKPNKKVLLFTAFADTATYLYENLVDWAHYELGVHVALVTGGGQNKTTLGLSDYNHILTNFSPEAKQRDKIKSMPQDEEITLLIATDCISEGQNLQDCDLVINYDIHWNPVRIIQRFGRIDRLKSPNLQVHLINFWPTENLDRYISLKHRVEARMALVDITTTADDNLLEDAPIEDLVSEQLRYRDRQLKRLQTEILDIEELNEDGLSLTEFTLDDFRQDLLNYIEANRDVLENAPLGLYTVVPIDPVYKVIAPGVIFCLRQKTDTETSSPKRSRQTETINPLQPHYLVYIRDDGNVRFTFAQPKQILEIYRQLCGGKSLPYQELCDLFDKETEDGGKMDGYSRLLNGALASIVHTFKRRNAAALQNGRDATLVPPEEKASEDSEFELITWLVIKEP
ncbi:MAG: helicase-related protein [bacterium]|nr:helicase-related protein [bacterium]